MHHGEDLLCGQWLCEYRHPELLRGLWVMTTSTIYVSFSIFLSRHLKFGQGSWTNARRNKVEDGRSNDDRLEKDFLAKTM